MRLNNVGDTKRFIITTAKNYVCVSGSADDKQNGCKFILTMFVLQIFLVWRYFWRLPLVGFTLDIKIQKVTTLQFSAGIVIFTMDEVEIVIFVRTLPFCWSVVKTFGKSTMQKRMHLIHTFMLSCILKFRYDKLKTPF